MVGDELWLYYGGWNGHHGDAVREGKIGLATIRLDGFVSMRASDEEGWLVTRAEDLAEPDVQINAKVESGGFVVAELLDQTDRVVPGFSRDECTPFTGDSVRHRVTWKLKAFEESQARGKKIRFHLKNADLFSYLPASR